MDCVSYRHNSRFSMLILVRASRLSSLLQHRAYEVRAYTLKKPADGGLLERWPPAYAGAIDS
jgi:hypothetical protein